MFLGIDGFYDRNWFTRETRVQHRTETLRQPLQTEASRPNPTYPKIGLLPSPESPHPVLTSPHNRHSLLYSTCCMYYSEPAGVDPKTSKYRGVIAISPP